MTEVNSTARAGWRAALTTGTLLLLTPLTPVVPAAHVAPLPAAQLPDGVLPLPSWARWSGQVNEYGWPMLDNKVSAPGGEKVRVGDLNWPAMARCESGAKDPNSEEARRAWDADDEGHAGGPRAGAFQAAYQDDNPANTWGYARDYVEPVKGAGLPVPAVDPYRGDPRKAPVAEQAVREQLLLIKEELRGPKQAWSYPGYEHTRTCRPPLFSSVR